MKPMDFLRALLGLLALLAGGSACAGERVVTLGGSITEMMFALGEAPAVVGVDTSSTWPEAARALPQVGYHRQLGAEGILSLKPTQLLGTSQAGPKETLDQLRNAGVPVTLFAAPVSLDSALALLQGVADARGKSAQGARIVAAVRERLARLPQPAEKPRVLAILAGQGAALVAGRDTAASLMIEIAGGKNVVQDFSGYQPMSAEALIGLAPEVLLVPEHVLPMLGGREGLLSAPGIAQTEAAKNGRVVVMDSQLLLGLGPRLGEAAEQLAGAFGAHKTAGR